jgi:hypothetical protein
MICFSTFELPNGKSAGLNIAITWALIPFFIFHHSIVLLTPVVQSIDRNRRNLFILFFAPPGLLIHGLARYNYKQCED